MKSFLIFLFSLSLSLSLISISFPSKSQTLISADELDALNKYQDTLKIVSDSILDAPDENIREASCYVFIRTLVRALKVNHSFYFPFDSLQRISILQSPDNKFRIFTWALEFGDTTYRYFGTIQMNDPKGLKLFPLFDNSPFMDKPEDSLTTNEKWFGVIYYRMITEMNSQGKPYYFLIGWDGNTQRSNKKIIDVLSFNSKNQPVFGASMFDFGQYDPQNKIKRFIIEYKKDAKVSVNYDEDLQMIVFDHLQPETPSTKEDRATYVPDGTYEGFKWENGKWHHVENVFTSTQVVPPIPDPVNFDKKIMYHPKK